MLTLFKQREKECKQPSHHLRVIPVLHSFSSSEYFIVSGESVRGETDGPTIPSSVCILGLKVDGLKLFWSLQKFSLGLSLPAGDLASASVLQN